MLLALAAAGGWGSGAARADGLISIPTAATLDPGQTSVDLQYNGAGRLDVRSALGLVSVQRGVLPGLAVGFDLLLTAGEEFVPAIRPNFAYVPLRRERGLSAAVGYENVGVRSFGEQPFVVLSEQQSYGSLHVGWTYEPDGNNHRAMLGVDVPLRAGLDGMADYINGPENFANTGLSLDLGGGCGLTLAYMRANNRHRPDGIFIDLNWQGGGN
jgi:hypothetical protein